MKHRIWNKNTKQYLTADEMDFVRVNAEGIVERLIADDAGRLCYDDNFSRKDWFELSDWVAEDEYYSGSVFGQWLPAPELEVEWGAEIDGILYCENDLIRVDGSVLYNAVVLFKYGVFGFMDEDDACFELIDNYSNSVEIIGNVHEEENNG